MVRPRPSVSAYSVSFHSYSVRLVLLHNITGVKEVFIPSSLLAVSAMSGSWLPAVAACSLRNNCTTLT